MITDISKLDAKRISSRSIGKSVIKPTETSIRRDNVQKLDEYKVYWDSLEPVRKRYKRCARFNRGDQWSDYILTADGLVREDKHIMSQGLVPMKQNIIRTTTKTMDGLFRSNKGKSIVISRKPNSSGIEKMLSNALQAVSEVNALEEKDAHCFQTFLLSGLPTQRIGFDKNEKSRRFDGKVDEVDPMYVFFNTDITEVGGGDIRVIGQLHDLTLESMYVHFSKSAEDRQLIRELYSHANPNLLSMLEMSSKRTDNLDFYFPLESNKCRVIEVWEKRAVMVIDYWDHASGDEGEWKGTIEELDAINKARIQKFQSLGIPEKDWLLIEYDESTSFKFFYKFLTPFGEVLREGISPYNHGSHPFVTYPHPLIDGEIWGFVEDFIDQQKQVNRLYTLQDFTLGTSAKNTLVLDKDSLVGQLPEDISATYREIGGVIVLDYKGGKNQPPKELTGKGVIAGVTEMIGMQLKWMQDISGVQPALQGQSGSAGTPASKYAMETQNATLNVKGFLDAFNWFRKERDEKLLSTIVQFYKTPRYLAISGNINEEDKMFDPDLLEGEAGEFTLTIGQSSDNPTYKGWMDEMLKELVINGMIDIEMFLKHSNFPFSKALLEDITNKKEQLGAGVINPQQAVSGLSQTFNNQVQNDPNYSQEKVNQLYKMMSQKAA